MNDHHSPTPDTELMDLAAVEEHSRWRRNNSSASRTRPLSPCEVGEKRPKTPHPLANA